MDRFLRQMHFTLREICELDELEATDQAFCVPPTRVFTPEAGKDYEAYLDRHDGKCGGVIRLLSGLETPGTIAKVPSSSCAKK